MTEVITPPIFWITWDLFKQKTINKEVWIYEAEQTWDLYSYTQQTGFVGCSVLKGEEFAENADFVNLNFTKPNYTKILADPFAGLKMSVPRLEGSGINVQIAQRVLPSTQLVDEAIAEQVTEEEGEVRFNNEGVQSQIEQELREDELPILEPLEDEDVA